jgi:hypothetical protein
VLCILSICLLIFHLSVAICEICLLYFTYGVCLVLSLKPGVTAIRLINRVDMVLRLQGSCLIDLKPDRCAVLYQIDSYLNLTEDQNYFSILQFLN